MLVKFDFSSKTGILVVKFAFATASLKIDTLGVLHACSRDHAYNQNGHDTRSRDRRSTLLDKQINQITP